MNASENSAVARKHIAAAGYGDPTPVWTEFLETIHGHAEGIIDLRFIDDRGTQRVECETIDEAVEIIAQGLERNVYVGIAKRRLPKVQFDLEEAKRQPIATLRKSAGGKANLSEVSAFWVDWDPRDDYADDDDAIGHREEFLIALEQCPTGAPSMIVWSGSGFHGYWLFEEPEDVSTPERVDAFERITKGMCRHFGTDTAATDASRVLRVPATLNWPNTTKRAKGRLVEPCVIYQDDNGRRF